MVRRILLLALVLIAGEARAAVPFDPAFNRPGCPNLSHALDRGDQAYLDAAVAYSLGVVDMLSDILCYVGDERCSCLKRLTGGPVSGGLSREYRAFEDGLLQTARSCEDSESYWLSGIAQRLALTICP